MKKRIFVIASAIVVVALIVGSVIFFTNKSKDEDVDEDIFGSSLSEETLTFYFPGEEPKKMSTVLEEIQKKSKSALNSKLVFKFLDYGEYATSIKDIASSSEACDAFFYTNQYDFSLADLDREGIIMDLSKVFPQDAPKYYSKFSKDELKAASTNGKLLAVPNRMPRTERKHVLVREDLMKKYNIPDIKGYSDYELYLKTVKSNEPAGTPMMFFESSIGLFAEANGYAVLDRSLGLVYKWDDPDMKIIPWEQTPEFKSLTNSIINWFANGYAQPGDYTEGFAPIEKGKISSVILTAGSDASLNRILESNGINWRYKAYSLYPDKPSERSSPLSTALVINSKTKNAGRVMKFIEWLESSQENYDLFMYGIKGNGFVWDADNTADPTDANSVDDYNWYGKEIFYTMDFALMASNNEAKEYMNEIERTTKYPPHTGFFPDLKAVKTEVDLRQDSFNSFEIKTLSGTLKSEDVDSFINEQKQNDIGKIVIAVQNQLNEWKAANK